jgi:hypothetical protein
MPSRCFGFTCWVGSKAQRVSPATAKIEEADHKEVVTSRPWQFSGPAGLHLLGGIESAAGIASDCKNRGGGP